MNRRGKIVAVNGVPIRKSEETPATAAEVTADRPSQRADREAIDALHALERERQVLTTLFNSYTLARDRARQLEISRRLDEIEIAIENMRPNLSASGRRGAAGSEQVAKAEIRDDRRRGAAALDVLLHTPAVIKVDDLPDPFELDNSLGVRSQPRITED